MRLKSWESPRSEGRNSKGKGGSARARQLRKQQQTLRKQLKAQDAKFKDNQNNKSSNRSSNKSNNKGRETNISFPYFLSLYFYLATGNLLNRCQKRRNRFAFNLFVIPNPGFLPPFMKERKNFSLSPSPLLPLFLILDYSR